MATIFTVHGTFAKASTGDTKEWWEPGSEFDQELRRCVVAGDGSDLKLEPVVWEATNSETARRRGAVTLRSQIESALKRGDRYSIVGHSHGGSIVFTCLVSHFLKRHEEKLGSIVTVGTPYLIHNPISETRALSFLLNVAVGITSWLAVLVMVGASIGDVNVPEQKVQAWKDLAATFTPLAITIALLGLFGPSEKRIYSREYGRRHILGTTAWKKWVCLFDKNDEAIHGLSFVNTIEPRIFNPNFVVPFFNFSTVLLLPTAAVLLAVFHTRLGIAEGSFLQMIRDLVAASGLGILQPYVNEIVLLSLVIMTGAGLLLLALLLVVRLIAIPVGWCLSWLFNKLSWNAVRKLSLGADVTGEWVKEIRPTPFHFYKKPPPLPEVLSEELNDFSNEELGQSAPRLRDAVSELLFLSKLDDPIKAIGKHFTWNELVHTSYFAIGRFRKLLFYVLANAPGFKPSPQFLDDPDYALVAAWYKEVQPTEPDFKPTTWRDKFAWVLRLFGRKTEK
jgi:hypothetical protein